MLYPFCELEAPHNWLGLWSVMMESYETRNPGVYLVARLNINGTNLAANSN